MTTETPTRWNHFLAYFFGGVFFANSIPHYAMGVTGQPFQSPFATPPGEGLSSALVNVLWGFFNLVIGYLLVCRVGSFSLKKTSHVVTFAVGMLLISIQLAWHFGRFHGGRL